MCEMSKRRNKIAQQRPTKHCQWRRMNRSMAHKMWAQFKTEGIPLVQKIRFIIQGRP